jgi:uncharacterized RmlC-like cupin family protein
MTRRVNTWYTHWRGRWKLDIHLDEEGENLIYTMTRRVKTWYTPWRGRWTLDIHIDEEGENLIQGVYQVFTDVVLCCFFKKSNFIFKRTKRCNTSWYLDEVGENLIYTMTRRVKTWYTPWRGGWKLDIHIDEEGENSIYTLTRKVVFVYDLFLLQFYYRYVSNLGIIISNFY